MEYFFKVHSYIILLIFKAAPKSRTSQSIVLISFIEKFHELHQIPKIS